MTMQIEVPSGYSDEEIKRAAEIREWLVKQISDKHEEVENLRVTLSLVDSMLKQGSFKTASSLNNPSSLKSTSVNKFTQGHPSDIPNIQNYEQAVVSSAGKSPDEAAATDLNHEITASSTTTTSSDYAKSQMAETRELHRMKDNLLLATADYTHDFVEIVPAEKIILNANTAPFRSFFLGRILDGMKVKDGEKLRQMQIKESEALNYHIEEDENSIIRKIRIDNYRDKERLNEIFNTCAWVFSRMIEKSVK
jgi:light-regulated signal transduction histidine kinase (bacteriophytochrome)